MLASVIIVSRDRGPSLRMTLTALKYQSFFPFEVIVVGDQAALDAVASAGVAEHVICVPFDEPNISAARNAGLAQAQGDVVAFIDDDAVPEPNWLAGLVAAFETPEVAVAAGFVRARNGIDFQWQGETVSRLAEHEVRPAPPDRISLGGWQNGTAPEAMGTNVAYRSSVLRAAGGFDPVFRYFLDDSDVNLRLSQAGHLTAVVPWAEVHHGLAPSSRRLSGTIPATLEDNGRSTVAFLTKHAPLHLIEAGVNRMRGVQRLRLLRLMRLGRVQPDTVLRLLASFDAGSRKRAPDLRDLPPIQAERSTRRLFREAALDREGLAFVAWRRHGEAAHTQAARCAAEGHVVTLFLFTPDSRYHRVAYHPDGYWLHTGGVWGRSERSGPLIHPARRLDRARRELGARRFARGDAALQKL